MLSLENILKEILPIYSRYMVCYTLDEQNEIINEFLDVIDANDMIREFKDIFYHSSSKYDNIKIALKQSILPDTAIELIRHFDDDTLGAICEGADYEGLEWEIMNFEDKIKEENRRMKTLDVFFLLYDIPTVKDIEKKFGYNNNLSIFLYSKLDFLKKGHVYSKEGFDNHCKKYCRDPSITIKTINKIIRYIYENLKYKKYDYEYKFSSCPVFKFPNETVKTYTSKNKPNKDHLNSTADFE